MSSQPVKRPSRRFPLLRRRACWVPTWQGWLVIGLLAGLVVVGGLKWMHPFLASTEKLGGQFLVVEGWVPDAVYREVLAEFQRDANRTVLVTGGPLEMGEPLAEYRTFAELGAATLRKLGLPEKSVLAVPAPKVRQDRTYANAVALRRWLTERGPLPTSLDVVSLGPHSRRTRLLVQKAFGDTTRIGIIAVEDERYDSRRWWRSSLGFRTATGELIAYVYARFLFRQPTDEDVLSGRPE